LPVVDRPDEKPGNDANQDQTEGNEQEENIHSAGEGVRLEV
jgi:hypothetical protein